MAARSVGRQGQGLVDAAAWESLGVVTTAVLAAIGLLYTVSARPKIRTFTTIPYRSDGSTWTELGALIYVANVGRAPTVIQSVGLRREDGNVSHKQALPDSLAPHLTQGFTPMILKPGDLAVFFTTDFPREGTSEQFGALELRPWRFGRAERRVPRRIRKRLPAWTRETWHEASTPDRHTEPVEPS